MARILRPVGVATMAVAALTVCMTGCTSFHDYVNNGFKVGPNYCKPAVPVAPNWIDCASFREGRDDLSKWWLVFRDPTTHEPDPVLNCLIQTAYRQNLTLRQAGTQILQARAKLAIARGDWFPQTQEFAGAYTRSAISVPPGMLPPNSSAIGTSVSI